jgi:hypothetical protein
VILEAKMQYRAEIEAVNGITWIMFVDAKSEDVATLRVLNQFQKESNMKVHDYRVTPVK